LKTYGDQIAHRAFEIHHQLPDVDEFAGLLADDMHAQQFFIAHIHDQLK